MFTGKSKRKPGEGSAGKEGQIVIGNMDLITGVFSGMCIMIPGKLIKIHNVKKYSLHILFLLYLFSLHMEVS